MQDWQKQWIEKLPTFKAGDAAVKAYNGEFKEVHSG